MPCSTSISDMTRHYVDAFVGDGAGGNRACVIELDGWLPDAEMLQLAKDAALPETAFFVRNGERFALRWFTPDIEMDLCGHATMAAAYAISSIFRYVPDDVVFDTASGEVRVRVSRDGLLTLDFPSRMPEPAVLPEEIFEALSFKPLEVSKARDYVLLYDSQEKIGQMQIDRTLFDRICLDPGGVIVTAPGKECDFVSRFFTPQATILEDPVTGSAHCSLTPYWSRRLGKKLMTARQLSESGGVLFCEDAGERVFISGRAKKA